MFWPFARKRPSTPTLRKHSACRGAGARYRFVPRVEALEDRVVPSNFQILLEQTGFDPVTIVDNGSTDNDPTVGSIMVGLDSAFIYGDFDLGFTLATSNRTGGMDNGVTARLDLGNLFLNNRDGAVHTLRMTVTDTDFDFPSGSPLTLASTSSVTADFGSSTVSFQGFADANNVPFGQTFSTDPIIMSSPAGSGDSSKTGFVPNSPYSLTGAFTFDFGAGSSVVSADGKVELPPPISGIKYRDLTGDGFSPDDTPLGGVTINLYRDINGNGLLDVGTDTLEDSRVTANGNGKYSFGTPQALLHGTGTYFVQEVVPPGYLKTGGPDYYTVTVDSLLARAQLNFANFLPAPAINIVKLTNGTDNDTGTGPFVPAGSIVTWTYKVTNSGNVALGNVAVTDDHAGVSPVYQSGDTHNLGFLDTDETWIYTATGTATAGQYSNLGTATGTPVDNNNQPIAGATNPTASNPDHYFGAAPAINIIKLTNGTNNDTGTGPFVPAGSTVTWTYNVSNPGNVALGNVLVTDDHAGVTPVYQSGDTHNLGFLDTDETWIYTASGTATAGQYSNVGTASGTPVDNNNQPIPGATNPTASNPDHYFGDTLTIGNLVWNDQNGDGIQGIAEPGIAGVRVQLVGQDVLGNTIVQTTTTDSNGLYSFSGLVQGNYTVTIAGSNFGTGGALAGYTASPAFATNPAQDSNGSPYPSSGTINYTQDDLTIDFGYHLPVTIGDFVWNDTNANGIQDSGETGIQGVTLTLTGTNGSGIPVMHFATTDINGHYQFTEAPGTYTVTVDASNFLSGGVLLGYLTSPTGQGGDASKDSNPSPTGTTPATLSGGQSDLTLDFGYNRPTPNIFTISGQKFYDTNGDGVKNDAAVVAGWTIYLDNDADFTNGTVASVQTDGFGQYTFTSSGAETVGVKVVPTLGAGPWYVYEGAAPSSGWLQTLGGGTAVTGNPGPTGASGATTGAYSAAFSGDHGSSANNDFGNLKEINGSGGVTLGFWTNKNGKAVIFDGGADEDKTEMAMLQALNLVTTSTSGKAIVGMDFDPAEYFKMQTWLKNASAKDMAYMLSAQLATAALSVEAGYLSLATVLLDTDLLAYRTQINALIAGKTLETFGALTYTNNGSGLSSLGYISIGDLLLAANEALKLDYNTTSADTKDYMGVLVRDLQNALQIALDKLNNNQLLFVA